ncbi:c-type cytochrome [Aquabacterium sp. OR-4]|uniref:c-type cytochrome n=1 Tax=Aquabacterium sp. OR-4 TaxID=2978127 RepID=UPI0021B31C8C|nr:c-type cytochrome [Aquabacterium sp. OR-4]MDT7836241.1 c-type cytochrome [Aquabacterium sp. OR-4]
MPRLVLPLLWLAAGAAQAQATGTAPAEPLALRALAATCANCHGTEGRALADSEVPGLAGERAGRLTELLLQFKRGERPATVMHQIAKGYSDAQLEALAAYFSRRPR